MLTQVTKKIYGIPFFTLFLFPVTEVVIIALIVGFLILVLLAVWFIRRRQSKKNVKAMEQVIASKIQEQAPEKNDEVLSDEQEVKPLLEEMIATFEEPMEQEQPDDQEEKEEVMIQDASGKTVYIVYNYSLEARLIQSSEEIQRWYQILSSCLIASGLKKRSSWKKESYYLGRTTYAKLTFRGKMLSLYVALEARDVADLNYPYQEVGAVKAHQATPIQLKIRSNRAVKKALELIGIVRLKYGLEEKNAEEKEFVLLPFQTKEELIREKKIKVKVYGEDGEEYDLEQIPLDAKIRHAIPLSKVSVDEVAVLPESYAKTDQTEETKALGTRKGIINIDTLSAYFENGDTVDLAVLKEKKLIPLKTDLLKVLARGTLDKQLTVKAHDFSDDAVKMIHALNGKAVRLCVKK